MTETQCLTPTSRSAPKQIPLTSEQLRQILHYDQDTGAFTWLINPTKRIKAGSIAGATYNTGYRFIGYCGMVFLAHRLAWLYVHGKSPEKLIDHINGVRTDNRICNLREATSSQNIWNRKRGTQNTSGFTGVVWHRGTAKWRAQCNVNGKSKHLGLFENPEAASLAYQAFIKTHRGEFAASYGVEST